MKKDNSNIFLVGRTNVGKDWNSESHDVGIAHKYADSSKIAQEKGAWELAVVEKYMTKLENQNY